MRAILVVAALATSAYADRWTDIVATHCGPHDEGTPTFGAGLSTGWRTTLDLVTHYHETDDLVFGMRMRFGLDRFLYGEEVQLAYVVGRGKVSLAHRLMVRFDLLGFAGGGLAGIDNGPVDDVLSPLAFAGGTLRLRFHDRFRLDLDARASYVPDSVPTMQAARGTPPEWHIEHHRAIELSIAFSIQLR